MIYAEWNPSCFDSKGLNGEDAGPNGASIMDWRVCPCGQNRDSDNLQKSNFKAALELLGGESDTVMVHNFGHWLCGWIEIIVVDNKADDKVAILDKIEADMKDYPLLDECDYYERQNESAAMLWDQCFDVRDRMKLLIENGEHWLCARLKYADLYPRAEQTQQAVEELL